MPKSAGAARVNTGGARHRMSSTGEVLAGSLLRERRVPSRSGVIDHHLLALHHVRDMPVHVPAYDWIFPGVGGFLFILVGWLLSRAETLSAQRV